MRSETATRALLLAMLVVAGYLMYLVFRPFLLPIAWAAVITVALQPVYQRMVRWLRGRQTLAAAVMCAIVALFILVPAAIAVIEVSQGLASAYSWLQEQVTSGDTGQLDRIRQIPVVAWLLEFAGRFVDLGKIDLRAMALSALQALGATAAAKATSLVSEALSTILAFVVVLIMTAIFFKEGETILKQVRRFLPLSEDEKEAALVDLRDVTRSVFLGSMLTALVQGILGGIGTAIVGLPSAVTFGAAMFFAALLPAGTLLVWGPAAAWLLITGHGIRALILVLWGALIVATVDNFMRPFFIGRGVKISPFLVFIGVLGGMFAFGLIGLFIGPLIITLFIFLLEVTRRDWFEEKGVVVPAPAASAGSKEG